MFELNLNAKCPKIINRNIELRPNRLFTANNINSGSFKKKQILNLILLKEPILVNSQLNKKKPYKSYGPSKLYGKEVLNELSEKPVRLI